MNNALAKIVTPSNYIEAKQSEINEGEILIGELEKYPTKYKRRISEVRKRIEFAKRFLELNQEGFIPLPRMRLSTITDNSALPAMALLAMVRLQDKFDYFAIIEPDARGTALDPILVGVIENGEQHREHFLIGWWRPDLITPAQLW